MKQHLMNLLTVLLFASLTMSCANAEIDDENILGDVLDVEVQVEVSKDEIVFEDDLLMDVPELPALSENDVITLDLSPEEMEL